MGWINLAQDKKCWRALVNTAMNFRVQEHVVEYNNNPTLNKNRHSPIIPKVIEGLR
jgi:hypothetical protein